MLCSVSLKLKKNTLNVFILRGRISKVCISGLYRHNTEVIMDPMASHINGVSVVYQNVCSNGDQRKHQSSVSLAFVSGTHRSPVNSPHIEPVTRKMFPFDDVIMVVGCSYRTTSTRSDQINKDELLSIRPATQRISYTSDHTFGHSTSIEAYRANKMSDIISRYPQGWKWWSMTIWIIDLLHNYIQHHIDVRHGINLSFTERAKRSRMAYFCITLK